MDDGQQTEAIEPRKETEARRKSKVIAQLLKTGYSDDEIFDFVSSKTMPNGQRGLALTRAEMREEVYKVYAQWAQEDSERAPYHKSMATRRILEHIRKASRDEKWTAVANMEKVLGMIQGTLEDPSKPSHTVVIGDAWTEAVMNKALSSEPEEFRRIVEEQRRFLLAEKTESEPLKVEGEATFESVKPAQE